eukprot:65210_1
MNYLYYASKNIAKMKLHVEHNSVQCIDNNKIVPLPMFEVFELMERNKVLYFNDICEANDNKKIVDYTVGTGRRRFIIQELPKHCTDINRLCADIDRKINLFIVFKKPNEKVNNKLYESDTEIFDFCKLGNSKRKRREIRDARSLFSEDDIDAMSDINVKMSSADDDDTMNDTNTILSISDDADDINVKMSSADDDDDDDDDDYDDDDDDIDIHNIEIQLMGISIGIYADLITPKLIVNKYNI